MEKKVRMKRIVGRERETVKCKSCGESEILSERKKEMLKLD